MCKARQPRESLEIQSCQGLACKPHCLQYSLERMSSEVQEQGEVYEIFVLH
jgi:hypothetical protein